MLGKLDCVIYKCLLIMTLLAIMIITDEVAVFSNLRLNLILKVSVRKHMINTRTNANSDKVKK